MSKRIAMRCVILVSFDADLGLLAADPDAGQREKTLSTGRYGATRGLHRVLQVLAEHTVPATWFIPTRNLTRYPAHAELLRHAFDDLGHELACAGQDLTDLTSRTLAEQVGIFTAAREDLAIYYGVTPVGYRVTSGEPHPDLADALHQHGFDWSSCLRGDDVPYSHPSGLVEIPRHHELDDAAYFSFNLDPPLPTGSPRINPIGTVLENWIIEFQAHHDEKLCFTLDLHTELIGTPARSAMLADLLRHIRAVGDVEFCTAAVAAQEWSARKQRARPFPADHPLAVFHDARHAYHTDTQGPM